MGKRRMVSAVAAEKSDEDEINDDSTKNDSDIESEEDAETADQETDEEDSMEVDEDDQVDDEEEATSEHSDDAEESIGKSRGTALKDAALDVEANVRKSGVIYLSSIPPGMNVAKLRDIMSQYGALGRIYLEPDLKGRVKKRKAADSEKHGQKYLEGWIEFKKKRIAKQVAESLNNAQVGGKRRSPYYESLWNIKYLNRFKWHHLSERLVHEKITRQHRLRQEVAQAKRQTNFFSQNIEKSKMLERIRTKKTKEGADFAPLKTFEISQRLTDAEIRQQKGEQSRKAATFSKDSSTGSGIQSVLANLFPRR